MFPPGVTTALKNVKCVKNVYHRIMHYAEGKTGQ